MLQTTPSNSNSSKASLLDFPLSKLLYVICRKIDRATDAFLNTFMTYT